jgi:hypothetical protein
VRKSRSRILLEKAISAMVSAIEVYNKPDHRYREETFSILALNAWELLLKAKILNDNGSRMASIHLLESHPRKDGNPSKKLFVRRNRSGNATTIGLTRALGIVEANGVLPKNVRVNIEALMEVRDNAVHYVNRQTALGKHVQELGAATLQNFVTLARRWFNEDLSQYEFFLMPLAFFRDFGWAAGVQLSSQEKHLLDFFESTDFNQDAGDHEFSVKMAVEVRLRRSGSPDAPEVRITNDPRAPAVTLTEADVREQYPWDYKQLCHNLSARYTDFVCNPKFHGIKKPLVGDPRYSMRRLLDPSNPRGIKKDFYSPNIVQVFDRHYQRRS